VIKVLKLKEFNLIDIEKEYEALQEIPSENGFENDYYGCSFDEFRDKFAKKLIDNSKGINLKPGYVPGTYYFLWDKLKIVGIFKIRHELNDILKNGAGHIGYAIIKKYQGLGYASKGLKLAIEICEVLIKEDEIYLSVHKDNIASLKVQQKNGAVIVNEDEEEYYTRIKLKRR